MCEFLNAIFLLNFENFEKILFDQSVVPKMEWEKPPRSLILENDVFVDTLLGNHEPTFNTASELKSTILSCIHLTMLKLKSLLKPSCQPSCFFRSADPIPFLHEFYHGQLNFEMPLIHLKSQIFYPIPRQVKS